jgi:hypothetical protein
MFLPPHTLELLGGRFLHGGLFHRHELAGVLLRLVHGGPVEFARIVILQALMLGQHVLGDIHRPAIAHHGWGVYNSSKSFTVTGTILIQTP